MFELKPITASGIGAALGESGAVPPPQRPVAAESICLDVLEIQHDNQEALVSLLLRGPTSSRRTPGRRRRPQDVLPRLTSEYDRGVLQRAHRRTAGQDALHAVRPGSQGMAWQCFRTRWIRTRGAIGLGRTGMMRRVLRWNTCARILNDHSHLLRTTYLSSARFLTIIT
jgi:hypothetical protein